MGSSRSGSRSTWCSPKTQRAASFPKPLAVPGLAQDAKLLLSQSQSQDSGLAFTAFPSETGKGLAHRRGKHGIGEQQSLRERSSPGRGGSSRLRTVCSPSFLPPLRAQLPSPPSTSETRRGLLPEPFRGCIPSPSWTAFQRTAPLCPESFPREGGRPVASARVSSSGLAPLSQGQFSSLRRTTSWCKLQSIS